MGFGITHRNGSHPNVSEVTRQPEVMSDERPIPSIQPREQPPCRWAYNHSAIQNSGLFSKVQLLESRQSPVRRDPRRTKNGGGDGTGEFGTFYSPASDGSEICAVMPLGQYELASFW